MFSKVRIIWLKEVQFWVTSSVLMYQGAINQADFIKGQVKNRCTSSSCIPHLQQTFLICFEYRPALSPVGSAFRSNRHAKVWILGMISLHFQTCFSSWIVSWESIFGRSSYPWSYITCKQAWYADFALQLPSWLSFQQRKSWSSALIMGVCFIIRAALGVKSKLISSSFHTFWLGSQRSLTRAG